MEKTLIKKLEWVRLRNPEIYLCYSEDGKPGLLLKGKNQWDEAQEIRLEIYGRMELLQEIIKLEAKGGNK